MGLREGKARRGGKAALRPPGVGLARGRSGRAWQRRVQAPQPPQQRGRVCRRKGKGDKKAKMKVKNQRKRVLGVKGGAGAPTGPGGRRGPSAVRAGKGVGRAGVSFRSQSSELLRKGWLARKTSWGSCVLGPWGINVDSRMLWCSRV